MQVEVTAGTYGEFVTDYLAENECRIQITKQLSVNDSVQFLGVLAQGRKSGLPFIFNLQAPVEASGWVSGNYSNQDWGGKFNDAYSMMNFAWGASVNVSTTNLLQSHVNARAARRHTYDNFLCRRRQERLWYQYNWRNPLVNPQVHRCDYERDGPVTQ